MTSAKHKVRTIALAAALGMFTACTPLSPKLDSEFGTALATLKNYQMIDPNASARTDNPTLDGKAAAESTGRYVKSYSAPTPHANVFTIGVSGAAR